MTMGKNKHPENNHAVSRSGRKEAEKEENNNDNDNINKKGKKKNTKRK